MFPLPMRLPLCTAALLSAGAALAQPSTDPSWSLGLGVSVKQSAYAGMGTSTTVIPLLGYENRWLRLAGPVLDVKLPLQAPLTVALRARYALDDGYEPDDAPVLRGMDERKSGVWLGAHVVWRGSLADLGAEWLADASGHSRGQRVRLSAEKTWRMGPVGLTPRLAVHWNDHASVDYYYGVRPGEALPGRPAYSASSATHAELGLRTTYSWAPPHAAYLDLGTTRLGRAVRHSPLVDRSSETALRLGYLHRF